MNNENNNPFNGVDNNIDLNDQTTVKNQTANANVYNSEMINQNTTNQINSTVGINSNQDQTEVKEDTHIDLETNLTTANKLEKTKKSHMILSIIGLVLSVLRTPYLYNEYIRSINYSGETFNLLLLIVGLIAIILYVVIFILKSNKKSKYVVGFIAGIMTFISGSILGNLVGILLAIDSGRLIKLTK